MTHESLGQYLRRLRGNRSLCDISDATNGEISHNYISTLEKDLDPRTGKPHRPHPDTLKVLATVYNDSYISLMQVAGYLPDDVMSGGIGGAVHTPPDLDNNRVLVELAALHSKFDSLAGGITKVASGIDLVSKVLDKIEEHDTDIRLLKKLATKEKDPRV